MTQRGSSIGASAARRGLLTAYVTATVGAAMAVVALTWSGSAIGDQPFLAGLTLLLIVHSNFVRVRYVYGGHTDELHLCEAALALSFIAFGATDVALLCASAMVVVSALCRVAPAKAAFNVAQWTIAALVGEGVYTALMNGATDTGHLAFAAVVATLATWLVNQLAVSIVLWLASGHPLGADRDAPRLAVAVGRLALAGTSVALVLVLMSLYRLGSWALLVAFVLFSLVQWTSRAYTAVRIDQTRLAGLQRSTHALSVSVNREQALSTFMAETRHSFDVRVVDLFLIDEQGWTSFRADSTGYVQRPVPGDIVQVLHDLSNQGSTSRRLTAGTGSHPAAAALLHELGVRDSLIAPLASSTQVFGLLCLGDRIGMEGFEEGESAVATAVATELVGFLQRADLVTQLMEEQNKLARIVDQTSDGILTLAVDGTIRTWNAALEAITGYHAHELVGTAHLGLLRARDDSGNDVWLEQWATLSTLPERLQIRTATGANRWLSCSFTRTSGELEGAEKGEPLLIVVARDVTAVHELERLKDDFVAVVSHELRTPLVPIKGWASMLLTRGDRMSAEQRRDALESIQAQAQRLERLILNILDASRIEGGLEPTGKLVDVSLVASRVFEEMLPAGATHVIRLHGAERPLMALGQPVWVERALANLLANAIKYAPADSNVDVRLAQEGDEITISVADEGPGIPVAWRERIFQRFERISDSETQTGTGLGLYITRQLVNAMGGHVELETAIGRGTTFTIHLSRAAVDNRMPAPRAADVPSNEPPERPRQIALPNHAH